MPLKIENDDQLRGVQYQVSEGVQAIQDYLVHRNCEDGRIKFPWGYIRRANIHLERYFFISDQILRRNFAYALIGSDVFRWILNRTTIKGVARDMIIKENICLMAQLIESLTYDILRPHYSKKQINNYKKRTNLLHEAGIITEKLRTELNWVWDARQSQHLFLMEIREHDHYDIKQSNRAVRAASKLRDLVEARFNERGSLM
ncbi:hypothetical protein EDC38_1546 [Marinimicrobium koreense]|uniref:Uncharacterized protein n=1 Tax=Marinimicrobium koreense TaxID=306545 RepID=A0A3N1P004_9GAMM|nr:hypothetical protein [Marinimicrobium koreense]ROQ20928.1 hypothetical protein EDC38_1546 [Marinimicrobium koreense]